MKYLVGRIPGIVDENLSKNIDSNFRHRITKQKPKYQFFIKSLVLLNIVQQDETGL